ENWFDILYYVKAESVEEKNKVLATIREYVNSMRNSYRLSISETLLIPVLSKIYCITHANCIK
ncbi:7702_t:CDS:1, partial [Funneliformis caledonium]